MSKQKPVHYLRRLAATASGNDKIAILREAAVDGCTELFEGFKMAYDKRRVFNVKKVPLIEGEFDDTELAAPSPDFNWGNFLDLADKLETRKITGNAARDALHEAASIACIEDWNEFYRLILRKDMRCGVTETTVNKVLKEIGGDALKYTIPVWKVQLAEDAKKYPDKLIGKMALDPKLDGMRLTTVLDKEKGKVQMFSRNGRENTNFDLVIKDLEQLLDMIPVSIVLDGEVVDDNFQALMTQANRKENIDTSHAHYALFDMLALEDFEKGGTKMTLMERHEGLVELQPVLQQISNDRIYVIPKLLVDLDTKEGHEKMEEFYDETVAAGYEGIMVKNTEAPYECKRSRHWLKWKPINSIDLIIVDAEEGKVGKKREGKLGAFVCEGIEDGKKIRVHVGSGYSDEQLDSFWQNRLNLMGEMVEVEYDTITKPEDADHYSLRFPRFKRFRSVDKDGKI